jgi:hypothetical protein
VALETTKVGDFFGWRHKSEIDKDSVRSVGEGSITIMSCRSEVKDECRSYRSFASLPRKKPVP